MRSILAVVPLVFAMNCLATPVGQQEQECVKSQDLEGLYALPFDYEKDAVPLVLGQPDTTTDRAYLTAGSWDSGFRPFKLDQGALLALEDGAAVAGSLRAQAGAPITFEYAKVPGPQNYCLQETEISTDLSVKGDNENFWLCTGTSGAQHVVYRAAPKNDGSYDFNTCYRAYVRPS